MCSINIWCIEECYSFVECILDHWYAKLFRYWIIIGSTKSQTPKSQLGNLTSKSKTTHNNSNERNLQNIASCYQFKQMKGAIEKYQVKVDNLLIPFFFLFFSFFFCKLCWLLSSCPWQYTQYVLQDNEKETGFGILTKYDVIILKFKSMRWNLSLSNVLVRQTKHMHAI